MEYDPTSNMTNRVECERKKAQIRAFSPTYSGNPVLEPKAARQGGKQGT
jgi:hypothetical protein